MRTFDFFDTLVTRLVVDPHDIFTLVGLSIGIDNFRELRIAAELKARRTFGAEVNFHQIYAQLDLEEGLRARAQDEELRIEKGLMSLIAENGAAFSGDDAILSDMYHQSEFFRDVLSDVLPAKTPKLILVSGEQGVNKHGGGMWRLVRDRGVEHEGHIGDNFEADVRQPRKLGLKASHYESSRLNPSETRLAETGLDGSLIAGASRATRLELIDSGTTRRQRAIVDTFASVFAPLIFGFSSWVIESCLSQGIRDVVFLARDGKIICDSCEALIRSRNLPIHAKYVYASRQALHLPGFRDIESAGSWLLDGTRVLSLQAIADRGGIPIDTLVAAAKGRVAALPSENLSPEQRTALPRVVRDPSVIAALERSSAAAFDLAREYYSREGMFSSPSFALVDIGWNGRMQASLRSLMDKAAAPVARILGLYVCLSRRAFPDPRDTLNGYLAEPPHGAERAIYDHYRNVLEAAFSADHATTVGFERRDGEATTRLGDPWSGEMQQRIELQHRVVGAFMRNIVKIEAVTRRHVAPVFAAIEDNLLALLTAPTEAQALAFVDFEFADGQVNDDLVPIARQLPFTQLLGNRGGWGYWPEGTLRASGFGSVMNARRLYHSWKYPSRVQRKSR